MIVDSSPGRESLGQELRRLREQRGWTLERAAQATNIQPAQIQAIESDDYTIFPSVAYVRGFVRIYARTLGLDDRRVVAKLDGRILDEGPSLIRLETIESAPPPPQPTVSQDETPHRVGGRIVAVVVLLMVGSILYGLWHLGSTVPTEQPVLDRDAPPPAIPLEDLPPELAAEVLNNAATGDVALASVPVAEPEPESDVFRNTENLSAFPSAVPVTEAELATSAIGETVAAVAAPAQVLDAVQELSLNVVADTWVRVILDGDESQPAFSGLLSPGETQSWAGFTIVLDANPAANIRVSLNGNALGQVSQLSEEERFIIPGDLDAPGGDAP